MERRVASVLIRLCSLGPWAEGPARATEFLELVLHALAILDTTPETQEENSFIRRRVEPALTVAQVSGAIET